MGNVLCGDGRGVENWENRKNRKQCCLLRLNRWCYDETDTTGGFSASNRSIHILKSEANNSWRMCYGGGFENQENRKNRKRFCLLRKNRWCYYETDTTVGFSASNRSIYILTREANNSWRMCYGGGLKIGKIEKIGNSVACYGRTGGAMMKRTPRLDSAHQIGLSTSSKGKLIIVGESVTGGGFENRENRKNRK